MKRLSAILTALLLAGALHAADAETPAPAAVTPAAQTEIPSPTPQPTATPTEVPLGDATPIYFMTYQGMISPVSQRYLERVLDAAEKDGAQAVVVKLDTPGGMIDPMHVMVQQMLARPFPVVVHVAPEGARAASAGTFLVLASDVAVMAPSTTMGAAHPVDSSGKMASEKITNALSEEIRALAERRNRDPDWAESAVRKSDSIGAEEARKRKIIDAVLVDEAALMEWLHERVVSKGKKNLRLNTAEAPKVRMEMTWMESMLQLLADPNIAYVLFLVGLYGIIFEVKSPGFGVGGITGVICLTFAFISFGSLPINYGGLSLLVFGIILLVAEAVVVSGGILGLGGAVSMLFGSFLLFGADSELYRVSIWLIALMVGTSAGIFLWLLRDALKVLRRRAVQDTASIVGHHAVCVKDVNPVGVVHVDGEDWSARCAEGSVKKGDTVKVIGVYGLSLVVEALLPAEKENEKENDKSKQKSKPKEEQ